MISLFKINVSISHLIDLLTLYLNKLIYLYSNECWNIFIGIYLFFHKKPCVISKNLTHLYYFLTKPGISNQSLVFE